MSIIRQRIHRKSPSGDYDTLYFESESVITIRPGGGNVEEALTDLERVTPRCASQLPQKLTPGQIVVVGEAAYIGSATGALLKITGASDTEYSMEE